MWRSRFARTSKCLFGGKQLNGLSTCQASRSQLRSLGLPLAAIRLQSRNYAVAAEETNKGVVSFMKAFLPHQC